MDIETLQALNEHMLEFSMNVMREGKELLPMFQLVQTDGTIEVMALDGPIMNSVSAKQHVSEMIRGRIAAGDIEAVAWQGHARKPKNHEYS